MFGLERLDAFRQRRVLALLLEGLLSARRCGASLVRIARRT